MPRRNIKSAVEGKRITRKTVRPKKLSEARTPAEIQHKKKIAIFLKVATYTPSQIAGAIGERVSTVRQWLKEPESQKLIEDTLKSLSSAAKEFLETLTIEAVKELGASLAHPDPKVRMWAVEQILDRGGIPKMSRMERKDDRPKHPEAETPGEMTLNLNIRTPEQAEELDRVLKEAEQVTRDAAAKQN